MRFVRLSFVLWAAAAGAVAVGLYQVKYDVQHLEERLHAVRDQIQEDRRALHVLEAEWNRLNRPDRLERLAAKHLDMGPTKPAQIAAVTQIPPRITREVLSAEERGEAPSLDGFPVPQAKPWSLAPSGGRVAQGPTDPAPAARGEADTPAADAPQARTQTAQRPAEPAAEPERAAAEAETAGPAGEDTAPAADGTRTISIGSVRIEVGSTR
jgi:hypothetical protein